MTHADSLWAKALELHTDSLQSKVDSLQAKLDALQGKTDFLSNVIETANDGVSNQLSATNNLLALVGVIVTIAAIWLGVLIEKRKRQIEKMAETIDTKKKAVEDLAAIVDDKKEKVDIIAKATEDLDKKIHGDITGLYNDLRKEETKTLFQRIAKEPLDIDNLGPILLAREVEPENFLLLKQAFLKVPEIPVVEDKIDLENGVFRIKSDTNHSFMLQFFQHFFYQSVKDDDIRQTFVDNFKNVFDNAFDSDIVRATEGLCKALTDADSKFDKVYVLKGFLKAINTSKFENFALLRKILEENLSEQGLLQLAIERCEADNITLSLFKGKTSESGQSTSQEINNVPGTWAQPHKESSV